MLFVLTCEARNYNFMVMIRIMCKPHHSCCKTKSRLHVSMCSRPRGPCQLVTAPGKKGVHHPVKTSAHSTHNILGLIQRIMRGRCSSSKHTADEAPCKSSTRFQRCPETTFNQALSRTKCAKFQKVRGAKCFTLPRGMPVVIVMYPVEDTELKETAVLLSWSPEEWYALMAWPCPRLQAKKARITNTHARAKGCAPQSLEWAVLLC